MKDGRQTEVADYLRSYDWRINDSKNFRQSIQEYQTRQRDGTHQVQCAWRSFNDQEIGESFKKVSSWMINLIIIIRS